MGDLSRDGLRERLSAGLTGERLRDRGLRARLAGDARRRSGLRSGERREGLTERRLPYVPGEGERRREGGGEREWRRLLRP